MSGVRASEENGVYSKEQVKELISDSSLKFTIEFLGQLEGGRWLVNLKSLDDQEDLGEVLVENNICVSVSDPPATFPAETCIALAGADNLPGFFHSLKDFY